MIDPHRGHPEKLKKTLKNPRDILKNLEKNPRKTPKDPKRKREEPISIA
jgi:hypothetical protein